MKQPQITKATKTENLNESEFRELYHSLKNFAQYRLRRHYLTNFTPEDIVQEAIMNTLSHNPAMINERKYLFSTVANVVYQHALRERNKKTPRLRAWEFFLSLKASDDSPEENSLQMEEHNIQHQELKQMFAIIAECLHELKATEMVKKMLDPTSSAFFPDQKPREIGPKLNVSPRTVSNKLLWIKKNVYPCVKKHFLKLRGNRHEE